ncbi:hypothetical protein Tco_0700905 [Tanacetum coccineum]
MPAHYILCHCISMMHNFYKFDPVHLVDSIQEFDDHLKVIYLRLSLDNEVGSEQGFKPFAQRLQTCLDTVPLHLLENRLLLNMHAANGMNHVIQCVHHDILAWEMFNLCEGHISSSEQGSDIEDGMDPSTTCYRDPPPPQILPPHAAPQNARVKRRREDFELPLDKKKQRRSSI